MFGVEVTLQDGSKAVGVLFPDRTIYVHEPVSDMWHSVSDMMEELGDKIAGFQVVGPVVPTAFVRQQMEEAFKREQAVLTNAVQDLHKRYKDGLAQLDEYDQHGGDVSFLKTEEPETSKPLVDENGNFLTQDMSRYIGPEPEAVA